jgi:hypothetical protein
MMNNEKGQGAHIRWWGRKTLNARWGKREQSEKAGASSFHSGPLRVKGDWI